MKLNWAERWVVNNPLRVLMQRIEILLVKKAANQEAISRALEIGCGRGAGARLILGEFKPATLVASDLDVEMLRRASTYLSSEEQKSVFLCTADVAHLPFPDACFDAVFGFGVLHHIPDWRRGLAEVSRVLRPGALYFLEELYPSLYQNLLTKRFLLHPTVDRFRRGDLREALGRAGFEVVATHEVGLVGIVAVVRKQPTPE